MEAAQVQESRRLLIYPVAWVAGRWRYLLFRHTLSRRGGWHGIFTKHETDCPARQARERSLPIELWVARVVGHQTGLQVTAVRSIDYAYRYSVLEHREGGFAPVHRDVLECVLVAFVRPVSSPQEADPSVEYRWFTIEEAVEAMEWVEHAEALQRCEALAQALAASLTPAWSSAPGAVTGTVGA
jgi:hypothetical protein